MSSHIGAYLAPDGLVYLNMPGVNGYDAGLSVFDPATNTITFIGYWPSAMIVQEFFFQNGYCTHMQHKDRAIGLKR